MEYPGPILKLSMGKKSVMFHSSHYLNMSCKWAIPGKLDWQCGINRTLCYGARLFAQLDVKGVSSSRQQDGGHGSRNPLRSV